MVLTDGRVGRVVLVVVVALGLDLHAEAEADRVVGLGGAVERVGRRVGLLAHEEAAPLFGGTHRPRPVHATLVRDQVQVHLGALERLGVGRARRQHQQRDRRVGQQRAGARRRRARARRRRRVHRDLRQQDGRRRLDRYARWVHDVGVVFGYNARSLVAENKNLFIFRLVLEYRRERNLAFVF